MIKLRLAIHWWLRKMLPWPISIDNDDVIIGDVTKWHNHYENDDTFVQQLVLFVFTQDGTNNVAQINLRNNNDRVYQALNLCHDE